MFCDEQTYLNIDFLGLRVGRVIKVADFNSSTDVPIMPAIKHGEALEVFVHQ
jgi:hypothetical protein